MLKKCKSIKVEIKLISNYQGVSIEHYDVDVFLQFYLDQTKLNTVVCKTIDIGNFKFLRVWSIFLSIKEEVYNVIKAKLF